MSAIGFWRDVIKGRRGAWVVVLIMLFGLVAGYMLKP
jgi:hypothetical protein